MPRIPLLAAIMLAVPVLAAAGCGAARSADSAAPAPATASRPGSEASATAPHPTSPAISTSRATAPASSGCPSGAWAYDITGTGTVAWRVTLPDDPGQAGSASMEPVVVAGVAVFAQGNALAGIKVSDGRLLWQRVFPQPGDSFSGTVYGLWGWDGSVIAQVGQVSPADRVLSLNPATGVVRWTLSVPELLGTQAITANGVLAMLTTGGTLEGADITSGKLLWSRPFGTSDGPAAVGTVVIATEAGVVAGFDARTGAQLWSLGEMPEQPTLTVQAATRVVVSDLGQNLYPLPPLDPVTGLLSATGQSPWAVTTGAPVSAVWATASGIVVATYAVSGHQPELLLIDPATGHVRWRVSTYADPGTAPLISASDLVYAVATPLLTASHPGLNQIVDRSAAKGEVRWSLTISPGAQRFVADPPGPDLLLVLSLGLAKTPAEVRAIDRATGMVQATVTLPGNVSVAPVEAGGATLVQAATPACGVAVAAHP